MLLKSLQLTVRNLRGITRVVSHESFPSIQTKHYGRFAPRHGTIVNEDELFDVDINNTPPKQPKKIRPRATRSKAQEYQKEFAKLEQEAIPRNSDRGYDEFESLESDGEDVVSDSPKVASKKVKAAKPQGKKKIKQKVQEEGILGDDRTMYTKLEDNEKIVSSIIMEVKNSKKRKKKEQIILEGARFIKDAIEAGIIPKYIIFSRWEDVKRMDIPLSDIKFFKVPYRAIQLYSCLTTPPGIMGIFDKPKPRTKAKSCLPITIICDNIRDPGNMGSILRAAAGVGCEKIILTKGCVNFWDFKVLRSAAGAHFRIPIHGPSEWPEIRAMISNDVNVYVADNNADNFAEEMDETEEYSEEIDNEEPESEVEEAKPRKDDKKSNRTVFVKTHNLPLVPYYAVDYTQKEVVLIVGGETEGISKESYDFVQNYQGIRVNVPLDNKIDSLNAGMALGVVAFEVKRQFSLIQQKLNELAQ